MAPGPDVVKALKGKAEPVARNVVDLERDILIIKGYAVILLPPENTRSRYELKFQSRVKIGSPVTAPGQCAREMDPQSKLPAALRGEAEGPAQADGQY